MADKFLTCAPENIVAAAYPDPDTCSVPVWKDYEASPFALDIEAANSIAVAILGVWAIAWIFKTIARHLNSL